MESSLIDTYNLEFKPFYDSSLTDSFNNWQFSQLLGEENEYENECEGDDSQFLAAGYNHGQVVILKEIDDDQSYQIYTEFKSHDSSFDFLTSTEIEEAINMIKWYPFPQRDTQRLLTTNDKTIKLFKLMQKIHSTPDGHRSMDVSVKTERVFEGGHYFNINSISFNSDGETFISSDDLRINLWNINVRDVALSTVDIKPDNMDDLIEVITCSNFHPFNCNYLIYSSSKGIVRMGDLREAALCERQAKQFKDRNCDSNSFFAELVTTISDVKFSPCGRMFSSRDYLSAKVWDIRQESGPLHTIKFNRHVDQLCNLYADDTIFDRFEVTWSHNSAQLLTGFYNNMFYVCNTFGDYQKSFQAYRPMMKDPLACELNSADKSIFKQKILHTAWHPKTDLIALGAKDYGYLYKRQKSTDVTS